MKVIDFEKKGNVIRLYLGADDCGDYFGDDWDDMPYEHNAGIVYGEYVEKEAELAFPLEYDVYEPADDWNYQGNSPFCKDDFKQRKAPCLIIVKNPGYDACYSRLLGSDTKEIVKIFYEDEIEKLCKKLAGFGAIVVK